MPASKVKKTKTIGLEERVKELENTAHEPQNYKDKCEELERKLAAIFHGMLEFKQDITKIKSRLGL